MVGHGYTKLDPAIEAWNKMRETAYQRFRFTPRTTLQTLIGLVLFPGTIYLLAVNQDQKWSWSGKLKGQSLSRIPSPAEESE